MKKVIKIKKPKDTVDIKDFKNDNVYIGVFNNDINGAMFKLVSQDKLNYFWTNMACTNTPERTFPNGELALEYLLDLKYEVFEFKSSREFFKWIVENWGENL